MYSFMHFAGLRSLRRFTHPVWYLQRSIFSPSLNPPPSTGPAPDSEGPEQETSAPHLSREKFGEIMSPSPYEGLLSPPKRTSFIRQTPEEDWREQSSRSIRTVDVHPKQFAGRSVNVSGSDVGQAWNILQSLLRQNNVRRELKLTERHEKKGVKRRRLRSERWRRRFAEEVKQKVKLVNEIRLRDRLWNSGKAGI